MAVITRTLKRTGGDYSTFNTWESGEQTDLVAAGDSHVLECYKGDGTASGGWQADGSLNDSLTLSGWVTGASNFITIKAASGDEHAGVLGDGFIVYENRLFGTFEFSTAIEHTVVQDITIKAIGDNLAVSGFTGGTLSRVIIESRSYTGSTGSASPSNGSLFRNCLIISGGRASNARGGVNTLENCTIIGVGTPTYGVLTDSDVTLKNCVIADFATEDVFGEPGTSTTNATSDASITSVSVVTTDGTDFVAPSTDDYKPTNSGALYGAGTDLSADFTVDITGTTRTTWDIGAYGYFSGGGTTITADGVAAGTAGVSATAEITRKVSSVSAQGGPASSEATLELDRKVSSATVQSQPATVVATTELERKITSAGVAASSASVGAAITVEAAGETNLGAVTLQAGHATMAGTLELSRKVEDVSVQGGEASVAAALQVERKVVSADVQAGDASVDGNVYQGDIIVVIDAYVHGNAYSESKLFVGP